MGLQTYIENQCREPHLYQLLLAWENFIICGMEEKCAEEQCAHICIVVNKDPFEMNGTTDANTLVPTPSFHHTSTEKLTSAAPETVIPEGEIVQTTKTTLISTTVTEDTTTTTTTTESTTLHTTAETEASSTSESEATADTEASSPSVMSTKEHVMDLRIKEKEREHRESQVHTHRQVMKKKSRRSAAEKNMCLVQTIVFGLILCLF